MQTFKVRGAIIQTSTFVKHVKATSQSEATIIALKSVKENEWKNDSKLKIETN